MNTYYDYISQVLIITKNKNLSLKNKKRCRGFLGSCFLAFLVSWLLCLLVSWFLRFLFLLVSSCLGFFVSQFLSLFALLPNIHVMFSGRQIPYSISPNKIIGWIFICFGPAFSNISKMISDLGNYKVSTFRTSKVSTYHHSQIPKFQSFGISKVDSFNVSKFQIKNCENLKSKPSKTSVHTFSTKTKLLPCSF